MDKKTKEFLKKYKELCIEYKLQLRGHSDCDCPFVDELRSNQIESGKLKCEEVYCPSDDFFSKVFGNYLGVYRVEIHDGVEYKRKSWIKKGKDGKYKHILTMI